MNIQEAIAHLTAYGLHHDLIGPEDVIYVTNAYLDLLKVEEPGEYVEPGKEAPLSEILDCMLDYAYEKGILENDGVVARDLFDTRLMGIMVERPSRINEIFRKKYQKDPKEATDWFYTFSQDTNYIRRDRIAKDWRWTVESQYGTIDISVNLSKPEKDPKAIAAGKSIRSGYPKCQLCIENVGYAGRVNHPARENHRAIPITIDQGDWAFQYSPYVYYNEHCIVFNQNHIPMVIDRNVFRKLFDFVQQFPHYFVGSNADLPIVGGSILAHEHFQGGHYVFAMEKAPIEKYYTISGYEDVKMGMVHWPLSVLRISGADPDRLVDLADHILKAWRGYSDEEAFVFAETNGERHNTITPIARRKGDLFELDLALRNNLTTEECPLGLYHPHARYHHIKKENIGLIEVMGLAVLPSRLKKEMDLLSECLVEKKPLSTYPELEKHAAWAEEFTSRYNEINKENVKDILQEEIGQVFVKVLEDAGVYKCTAEGREAFERFIATL